MDRVGFLTQILTGTAAPEGEVPTKNHELRSSTSTSSIDFMFSLAPLLKQALASMMMSDELPGDPLALMCELMSGTKVQTQKASTQLEQPVPEGVPPQVDEAQQQPKSPTSSSVAAE